MESRVLGPVELRSCGQRQALESGKVSGILAILLLTPGKIVAADDLIDRLRETSPPAGARGNLSVYVSRLRASFRRAGEDAPPLRGRASGYVLDVDPDTVDLHQFRRLRRRGSTARDVGQSSEAVRLLREADLLWHGPAIAGLSGEWFAKMRESVQEERRAAVIERVKLELDLGLHVSLVGEIARLLDQYPMDETLIEYQMTALYRSGRISEALSLFRETRSRLAEEHGTEPGYALAELHHRILRQDPYLSAPSTRVKPLVDPSRDTRPMAFPRPLSERRCAVRRFLGHCLAAADLADRRLIPPKCQVPIVPRTAHRATRLGPCRSSRPLRSLSGCRMQGERNPGATEPSGLPRDRHKRARERHLSMTPDQITLARVAPPTAAEAGRRSRARRPQGVGRGREATYALRADAVIT